MLGIPLKKGTVFLIFLTCAKVEHLPRSFISFPCPMFYSSSSYSTTDTTSILNPKLNVFLVLSLERLSNNSTKLGLKVGKNCHNNRYLRQCISSKRKILFHMYRDQLEVFQYHNQNEQQRAIRSNIWLKENKLGYTTPTLGV